MLTNRLKIMLLLYAQIVSAVAETLPVTIKNQASDAVENAVVYLLSPNPDKSAVAANDELVIDQIDKEFVHPVTVIRPGTSIIFPNHDQIRHHVYSFSPAKSFELPLYKELTPKPVRFEQAGVIALGCNIHDWMSAYIFVVDSRYTAITDANGLAVINAPPGQYRLQVWHARLKEPESQPTYTATINPGRNAEMLLQVDLKKSFKSHARSSWGGFDGGAYR